MTAPQSSPQPLLKKSTSEKVTEQAVSRVYERASSDYTEPPKQSLLERLPAGGLPSKIDKFQKAMADWTRLALVVPVLALLVIILGPDEAGIGDFKFKATGLREVIVVASALLIVKLARDASRLLSINRFGDLSVELSDASAAESYVNAAYVRPSDLFRAKFGGDEPQRTRRMLSIERTRSVLLWMVTTAVGAAVLGTLGRANFGMVAKPTLTPPGVSYGLAALATTLLSVAGLDVLTIVIARWPRLALKRQRWRTAVAECEREAALIKLPLPSVWPPLTETRLIAFQKEIEVYKVAGQCERDAPRSSEREWTLRWTMLPDPWPVDGPYRYNYLRHNLPGHEHVDYDTRRKISC